MLQKEGIKVVTRSFEFWFALKAEEAGVDRWRKVLKQADTTDEEMTTLCLIPQSAPNGTFHLLRRAV